MRLSGDCLGQQCFARAGRTHEQCALGKLRADLDVFAGIVEEIHHFLQGLLGHP